MRKFQIITETNEGTMMAKVGVLPNLSLVNKMLIMRWFSI